MSQIIRLDARVATYSGNPVRILAVYSTETEQLAVGEVKPFAIKSALDSQMMIVTDSTDRVHDWQLHYREEAHLKDAVTAYFDYNKAKKISLKDHACDPTSVVQIRKYDETGRVLELDTSTLNNAHVAALLLAWAAKKAHMGAMLASQFDEQGDEEYDSHDDYSLPFVI